MLKRIRRVGWWHVGVRDPESVAEHSLRVAQLAALIAVIEGAEPGRAALLAIWHDSQETHTGNIPHTAKPYLHQHSPEAHCTKDADKLECLIQAIEYQDAGYTRVQGWINSARSNLRTDTARRIADAALRTSPLAWRGR
ncbi:MAG: HD domain-containing protein [Pseudonocardiaceae bacterium]